MNLGVYPPGTPLRLRLTSGERVEGVLVSVEADTVSVQSTPGEPARVVAQASIAEVSVGEVAKPGRAAGLQVLYVILAVAGVYLFYYLMGRACEDSSC